MSSIKHAINPSFSPAWIGRVGKLILNFGVLELETYLWFIQLSERPDRIPEFTTKKFADRVQEIIGFVKNHAHSEEWKNNALEAWEEALHHAKFRNRIAHSPLVFGWTGRVEEGEPDFIGVVDLQRRDLSQTALASKGKMDAVINSIVSLATRLSIMRQDWCAIRDAKK
jgi:hypothetical protein